MRTENHPRPSRLLRVREFTDKVAKQQDKSAQKTSRKSRFVAPYYFSGDDQAAIARLLQENGVGDAEGVLLFVTAAEYEVGSLRHALQEEPPPRAPAPQPKVQSKADIELAHLGQSAAKLQAMLSATHNTARSRLTQALSDSDPFARQYRGEFLTQLEMELGRIAAVCEQLPEDEQAPPEAVAAPIAGPTAIKLLSQLARIYQECLDTPPEFDDDAPFCQILCIIRDSADINLPFDAESLKALLS